MAQSWVLWWHVVVGILTSFSGKSQGLGVMQQILHIDTLGIKFQECWLEIDLKVTMVLVAGNKNVDVRALAFHRGNVLYSRMVEASNDAVGKAPPNNACWALY
jgi:hypothetical protein